MYHDWLTQSTRLGLGLQNFKHCHCLARAPPPPPHTHTPSVGVSLGLPTGVPGVQVMIHRDRHVGPPPCNTYTLCPFLWGPWWEDARTTFRDACLQQRSSHLRALQSHQTSFHSQTSIPTSSPMLDVFRLWTGWGNISSVSSYGFNLHSAKYWEFLYWPVLFLLKVQILHSFSFSFFYFHFFSFSSYLSVSYWLVGASYTFWTLIFCQLNALPTTSLHW